MSTLMQSIQHLVRAAASGALLIAVPAVAAPKPKVVTVPAATIADPARKLCMPRTTSPLVAKDKTLPATLCQTVGEWAAHGVTVKAK